MKHGISCGYSRITVFIFNVLLWTWSNAQYPPSQSVEDIQVVISPADPSVMISYKTPDPGTCTTVFSTQRQYTGYISLPANTSDLLQDNFTINTFFWFFEARQVPETAPLTVFINGGPGSSSMVGLFQEVGPCEVVELDRSRLGTVARQWGWDRSSNILFIDQPVQAGFSYDTLTNASLNLLDELISVPATNVPITQPPYTFLNGTFGSQNPLFTANTSDLAARSLWHFMQGFLPVFPQYDPTDQARQARASGKVGINLFTESYGGKYGPAIAKYFQNQNRRRESDPAFRNATVEIEVATVGIMNGWVDLLIQAPSYPRFAYNNTYGVQAVSQLQELNAISSFDSVGGCKAKTLACRQQEASLDPGDDGDVDVINQLCSDAQATCQSDLILPFAMSGRSIYDISQHLLDPFPDPLYLEYLNSAVFQQAIGVPVNYTQASAAVTTAFNQTGDWARDSSLQDLVDILLSGVRVALIYGDRDYICNWEGGQDISFAIAGGAGTLYQDWYAAGYAPIVTNASYIGGVVREFANLSFSRIYDSGHLVPAYQPETGFTVFSRIIQGTDVSFGRRVDLSQYASTGDQNSTRTSKAPEAAAPICHVRAVNTTCDIDQRDMLANGAGTIINGILYASENDWRPPAASLSLATGSPGKTPESMLSPAPVSGSDWSSGTSMVVNSQTQVAGSTAIMSVSTVPTGVFTATAVPSTSSSRTSNAAPTVFARGEVFSGDTPSILLVALVVWGLGLL